MNQNQEEYDNTKSNINEEITVINDERTEHMEVLANTISAINVDTESLKEKDQQKRDLQKNPTRLATSPARKPQRFFSRICAVRRVRNEPLIHSSKAPPFESFT